MRVPHSPSFFPTSFSAMFAGLALIGAMVSPAHALNFGTYNIRNDNAADAEKGNGWERRAPVVANIIRFHGFDIVGTQEGKANQVADLSRLMPEYSWTGCGREDGRSGGEHIAIFYRKDKFKLLNEGHFWLSETPTEPSKGWDASLKRICAWGKFSEIEGGKTFYFFSTHFDHRGELARKNSSELIIRAMKKLAVKDPAIVCGDFNVDQTSESYRIFTAADGPLKDSHELAPIRLDLTGTPNNFNPSAKSESRIDHVFVTSQFTVRRYGILTDSYRAPKETGSAEGKSGNFPSEVTLKDYEARLPSDHFPVLIEADLSNKWP